MTNNKGIKSLWGYPLIDSKGRHAIDDVRSNLENNFQKKTDDTLTTTSKTIIGAINEINTECKDIANEKINVKYFGAIGDGITDDSDSIQRCFDYAFSNNKLVVADSGKTYKISKQIRITNPPKIDFNSSIIKVVNETIIDSVLYVDLRKNTTNDYFGYIKNVIIDCNNKAKIGFVLQQGRKGMINNIEVYNPSEVGYHIEACHELDAKVIRGENCPIMLRVNSSDTNFNGVYGRYCNKFIENLGYSNYYSNLHAWCNENTYSDSVFFTTRRSCFIQNGYSDTYETSFSYKSNCTVMLNSMYWFWNTTLVPISDKPILFDFGEYIEASANLRILNSFVNISSDIGASFYSTTVANGKFSFKLNESNSFANVVDLNNNTLDSSEGLSIEYSEGVTMLKSRAKLKDKRVCINMKVKYQGVFNGNSQKVIATMGNTNARPDDTIFIPIHYSVDNEWDLTGLTYGQILHDGTIKPRFPRVESTTDTIVYFYINAVFDV